MEPSTILVVEDERIIAADLRDSLQGFGYKVPAIAINGVSAIELAKKYQPDLILMDIFLDGNMNGIEAAQQISQVIDVPVIFVTAFSDTEIIEKAKITEPYGYILKPYDDQEVRTAIEIALYRHAMDNQIKESEQRFRSMFNGHRAVMLLLSPDDGTILDANPAATEFYGYSRGELCERHIQEISRAEEGQETILSPGSRWVPGPFLVSQHQIANREVRLVEIYSTPVNIDGKPVLFSIIHDITGRRNAEIALRKANRQLMLLNGITRHDILNKITVILGYIALEKMTATNPLTVDHLKRIESSTMDIRSQIEFTRVYQDLGTHEAQWQALEEIIFQLNIPAGVSLIADISGYHVYADPMLERVFFNLLDNSIRHGQRVTEIHVLSYREGNALNIVWEDNGVGIAAEDKERIFEPEFGKNTGLGLFLVREILSISGISIRETGSEGVGARFEITVPAGDYKSSVTPVRHTEFT